VTHQVTECLLQFYSCFTIVTYCRWTPTVTPCVTPRNLVAYISQPLKFLLSCILPPPHHLTCCQYTSPLFNHLLSPYLLSVSSRKFMLLLKSFSIAVKLVALCGKRLTCNAAQPTFLDKQETTSCDSTAGKTLTTRQLSLAVSHTALLT